MCLPLLIVLVPTRMYDLPRRISHFGRVELMVDGSREDVKCIIPDDRPRDEGEGPPFICVRGSEGCEQAIKFAKIL